MRMPFFPQGTGTWDPPNNAYFGGVFFVHCEDLPTGGAKAGLLLGLLHSKFQAAGARLGFPGFVACGLWPMAYMLCCIGARTVLGKFIHDKTFHPQGQAQLACSYGEVQHSRSTGTRATVVTFRDQTLLAEAQLGAIMEHQRCPLSAPTTGAAIGWMADAAKWEATWDRTSGGALTCWEHVSASGRSSQLALAGLVVLGVPAVLCQLTSAFA